MTAQKKPEKRTVIGRPADGITPEQVDVICKDIINSGNNIQPAALAAGVKRSTLYKYKQLGQRDLELCIDSPYARFVDAISHAESLLARNSAAALRILSVDKVGKIVTKVTKRDGSVVETTKEVLLRAGSAAAASFFVERRFRSDWGRHDVIDHNITSGVDKAFIEKLSKDTGVPVEELIAEFERVENRKLEIHSLEEEKNDKPEEIMN